MALRRRIQQQRSNSGHHTQNSLGEDLEFYLKYNGRHRKVMNQNLMKSL
jgi:hypothetical protein